MSRKLILVAAFALALVIGIGTRVRSQQTGVLVVDGATLIDGTGAPPVRDSVIVIENGKFAAAGPRSKVRIPEGARVVDAKGKYAIPGLIDGHVHYRSWMGELFVNNGITTVFDFGNPGRPGFQSERCVERSGKDKMMPRLFVVGDAINRPGGDFSPSFGTNTGTPARKRCLPERRMDPIGRVQKPRNESPWALTRLRSLPTDLLPKRSRRSRTKRTRRISR